MPDDFIQSLKRIRDLKRRTIPGVKIVFYSWDKESKSFIFTNVGGVIEDVAQAQKDSWLHEGALLVHIVHDSSDIKRELPDEIRDGFRPMLLRAKK